VEETVAETVPVKIEAPKFQPYVPADEVRPEFTFRAIFFGGLFGILFGAVTVYVGLRAGLTVSASIPIAVLSISVLRALGKASILENNIVQTAGSAGESVAGGVIFTLPALIFLGFPLEYARIFLLAFIGGWLGVLFMIPLRRQLIVKEQRSSRMKTCSRYGPALLHTRLHGFQALRSAPIRLQNIWAWGTSLDRRSQAFSFLAELSHG
jgi:hypothetical protein